VPQVAARADRRWRGRPVLGPLPGPGRPDPPWGASSMPGGTACAAGLVIVAGVV